MTNSMKTSIYNEAEDDVERLEVEVFLLKRDNNLLEESCREYEAEIAELKEEIGYSVTDLTEAQWQDAQNEIARLKDKYHLVIGWWYAEACYNLDNGIDTREINISETIERMERNLGKTGGKQNEPKKKD